MAASLETSVAKERFFLLRSQCIFLLQSIRISRLHVAREPQALKRFQREAQAASSLDHPNICTIHDTGEQDRKAFIAMELLEGATLKHNIAGRPLVRAATENCDGYCGGARRGTLETVLPSVFIDPGAQGNQRQCAMV